MCITIDQIELAFGLLLLNEFNAFVYCCTKCQCEYDSGPNLESHILDAHQDDKGHIESVFVNDADCLDDIEEKPENCFSEQQGDSCSKENTVLIEHETIGIKPEPSEQNNQNRRSKKLSMAKPLVKREEKPSVQNKEKPTAKRKFKEKIAEELKEENEEEQPEDLNNDFLVDDFKNESSSESDDAYEPFQQTKKAKAPSKLNAKILYCDMCPGRSFNRRDHLTKHMNCHIKNRIRKTCPICNKKPINFGIHMRNEHPEARLYKCDWCEKLFKTNESLQSHVRSHTGEKPFLCSICGKTFVSRSLQLKHQKRVHSERLPHPCKHCDKSFISPSVLLEHFYAMHSDARPYACDICNKSFSTKKYLRIHKRFHGEKTKQCTFCDASFYTVQSKRLHEKSVHKIA